MPRTTPLVRLPAVAGGRRAALAAVVALTSALAWLLPAAPAPAAAACDGVTVRVERAGGSAVERCVTGATPSTGLQALERAGFRYTFVPGQPGMVCTIDGYPDPCNDAPDDAYWAYWHADAGASSWTYSSRGGGNRAPSPGGHEAWVFGGGMQRPPSSPPPPAPGPTPTPTPTPSPAPTPSPSPTPAPTSPPPSAGPGDRPGSAAGSGSGTSTSGRGGSAAPSGDASTASAGRATDTPTPPDRERDPSRTSADDRAAAAPGATSDREASAARVDDDRDEPGPDPTDDPTHDRDAELVDDAEAVGDPDASAADSDPDVIAGDDAVAIGAPGGGRSLTGVAVGGTLAAGLAGAAVLRARRRDADLGPDL